MDSPVVVTHTLSFYFREEHVWLPKLMLFEVSARELIAKLPEEIPEEEREARKDGNSSKFSFNVFFHPEYLIFTFFLNGAISSFRVIRGHRFRYISEGGPGHPSQAWMGNRVSCVGELRDYLQRECGEGEALPDNVFRDVMLQVTCTHNFLLCFQISLKTRNPLTQCS